MKVVTRFFKGTGFKTISFLERRAQQEYSVASGRFENTGSITNGDRWLFVKRGKHVALVGELGQVADVDGYGSPNLVTTPARLTKLLEDVLDGDWATVQVQSVFGPKSGAKLRARPSDDHPQYIEFIAPCGHRGLVSRRDARAMLKALPELMT